MLSNTKNFYLNIPISELKELTANEANLFAFIKLRLNISKVYIEGQKYVCLTYKDILENFNNISRMTVRRTIAGLIRKKRIQKTKIKNENRCNPNSSWYSVLNNEKEQSECSRRTIRVFKKNNQSVQEEQSECSKRTAEPSQTSSTATDSEPLNKYIIKYINKKENTPLPPHEGDMVFVEDKKVEEEEHVIPQAPVEVIPEPKQEQKLDKAETQFQGWWDGYGHKVDRLAAFKAYKKSVPKKVSHEVLMQNTKALHKLREQDKQAKKFVPTLKNPATWLNNECWKDERLDHIDVSHPEDNKDQLLDQIRQQYDGDQRVVREQLIDQMGIDSYKYYLNEAEICFLKQDQQAQLFVRNGTVADLLKSHHNSDLKSAFNHIGINNIKVLNVKDNVKYSNNIGHY